MVSGQLEGHLVEVLHASVDFSLVWTREAKVYYVEQVGEEKDVDANVWVLQTRHCEYRKSQSADQEHYSIDILAQSLGPNAQVQAANSLSNFLPLQNVLSLVQDSCEDEWKQGQGRQ